MFAAGGRSIAAKSPVAMLSSRPHLLPIMTHCAALNLSIFHPGLALAKPADAPPRRTDPRLAVR
ncbi:hypothetical protein EMIT0P201_20265 [Pseudomonas chlororaphis]